MYVQWDWLVSVHDPLQCTSLLCDGNPLRHALTGSYHNYFRIYDVETTNDVVLQADKSAFKAKKIGANGPGIKGNGLKASGPGKEGMNLETIDFNKKILHGSWHPRENTIAVRVSFCEIQPKISSCTLGHPDSCHQQLILGRLQLRVPLHA